ncbi:chromosomal replication initiator protein DnaA [Sphingomonas sp. LaA6.9]|uniref:chromosomal replication initiator protein DnaA n=1 Tax=Sphingomonas sp. LaA6.9 TaxID=2919914 RepID=UPI001F4F1EA9|nr:chromosomal replication initiator protein DnaA [Sphingomonas sp. LaA6.9]MCJ8157450.1 chromosomal replication initiator protein DnaA [Sphingomonas sp. LaA6.9]
MSESDRLSSAVEANQGTLIDAWTAVRAGLRRDCGARTFDHWLKPIRLGKYRAEDRTVEMVLPSPFMARWVESHFAERLALAWRTHAPEVRSVEIIANDNIDGAAVYSAEVEASDVPPPVEVVLSETSTLDKRFTFDNFVTGDANALACNAARVLAEGGVAFNPLFIHGATGQGKTHLLHAIGHAFAAANPGSTVLYMSAEKFMVEFVSAMRARDTLGFKARLRSADLLMIDDVQFIAGKGSTQEEFLHTVNEIMASGRKLVIGADRSPQALEGVEGRILSRLAMGLVADIRPADYALRLEILRRKVALAGNCDIPEEVVLFLAQRIASNIRELEGALNRVLAYSLLNARPIDMEFVQEVLADVLQASQRRVTIDEIQRRVCQHFDIRQNDMVSARRARAIARPRQIAMYLAKRMTPRSLPEIGRKFGGRDHTTVIHAVRQIEKLRAADAEMDNDIRTLIRTLEG